MNIVKIRNIIRNNKNKTYFFKYIGSRGQKEKFHGVIKDAFHSVFLVKSLDDNRIKSFSYADILIGNLHILTDEE